MRILYLSLLIVTSSGLASAMQAPALQSRTPEMDTHFLKTIAAFELSLRIDPKTDVASDASALSTNKTSPVTKGAIKFAPSPEVNLYGPHYIFSFCHKP